MSDFCKQSRAAVNSRKPSESSGEYFSEGSTGERSAGDIVLAEKFETGAD